MSTWRRPSPCRRCRQGQGPRQRQGQGPGQRRRPGRCRHQFLRSLGQLCVDLRKHLVAERLLDLGAAVVRLLPVLARKPGGKAIVSQLERCGPAGGSNYEEARGAESPADFVHKTRIALKEVRETRTWLRLAVRARLLEVDAHLAHMIDESDQLVAILTASANTARRRAERTSTFRVRIPLPSS